MTKTLEQAVNPIALFIDGALKFLNIGERALGEL